MRERSRRARAKSVERVERRAGVLSVVVVVEREEDEGQRAVTVGLRRNSRVDPRVGAG